MDRYIICSVDCRERNGLSSFSMLLTVRAAGPHKWNFLVFLRIFTDKFFANFGQTIVPTQKCLTKRLQIPKNNWSLFGETFSVHF